jgi:DDE superfamily endonuclease
MCKLFVMQRSESSKIASLIEGLPEGYYTVGDNAYVNSNHLLVPFPGKLSNDDPRDAFNFYLSQLRVRVENCFALLVGRWGIFWGPLQMPLRYQPMLIKAVCCLHNFCIDEGDIKPDRTPNRTRYSAEAAETDEEGRLIDPSWRTQYQFQCNVAFGSLRDDLVSFIASECLVRPPSSRPHT